MADMIILNEELIESSEVSQGVWSRGFAFGYGLFETIKFVEGSPCFFSEHLARLDRGLKGAGIPLTLDEDRLAAQARQLFRANTILEGVFKIVVWSGSRGPELTIFVRSKGLTEDVPAARLTQSTVCKASAAFTSRHKTLNYMESVMALESASRQGFDECVFCNELGYLTECSVANVFFVSKGTLKTPDLECGLLDGIVRAKVIEIAKERGIAMEEGLFTPNCLLEADEVFLTSSGKGLRVVSEFVDATGRSAAYLSNLLPELRLAYLELERASVARG